MIVRREVDQLVGLKEDFRHPQQLQATPLLDLDRIKVVLLATIIHRKPKMIFQLLSLRLVALQLADIQADHKADVLKLVASLRQLVVAQLLIHRQTNQQALIPLKDNQDKPRLVVDQELLNKVASVDLQRPVLVDLKLAAASEV